MEEDGAATPADAAHAALLRTITDTIAKHPEEMELLGAFVKIAKEVKAPVATAEQVKLLDSKAWKESLDKVQKASSACKAAELKHTKQGKKVADCEKALREAQAQLERDQQDVQDKRDHQEKMAAEHRRKFPTGDPGAAAAGADARPQQEPDDLAALQTKDDYHKYKIKLDEQVARLDRLYKQKFPPVGSSSDGSNEQQQAQKETKGDLEAQVRAAEEAGLDAPPDPKKRKEDGNNKEGLDMDDEPPDSQTG